MTGCVLVPGETTLTQLADLYWNGLDARLDDACEVAVRRSAGHVERAAADKASVYGVNTGFGKLASVKISPQHIEELQRNLILSHCCGVGAATPQHIVRLMMSLKLLCFGRGASGVRWELVKLLQNMLARGVYPVVPSKGSVGASGDLAPLAHMTAVMIGEGWAEFDGEVLPGGEALRKAGLSTVSLKPKEGLACINGTQFSTAYALSGLFQAWRAVQNALVISALSTDAVMGLTVPLRPEIHTLRGHRGQVEAAAAMASLLRNSGISGSHGQDPPRVQDPYCLRCQPQVTGAAMDVLRQAAHTLMIEANAATDNPLVVADTGDILSGGNFHAEPVGFAADMIALAIAEVGAISQRRIALLVDASLNGGLPPFLTPKPGLNSGFMIADVCSAALMSENKHLANPCVTDSTPTSANQEDHVSMAAHGARRLTEMVGNLNHILGIELLCAACGVELRAPSETSNALQKVVARLRAKVPTLDADRYMAPDLEAAAVLVASGDLTNGLALPELEEVVYEQSTS